MSEWQPIETAPKDGTPILAYPCTESSWYSEPHDIDVIHCESGGWYLSMDDGVISHALNPTHWMPLPEAPK